MDTGDQEIYFNMWIGQVKGLHYCNTTLSRVLCINNRLCNCSSWLQCCLWIISNQNTALILQKIGYLNFCIRYITETKSLDYKYTII